jgi:hypothetical protein
MDRIYVYSITISGLSQNFVHPSLRHPYDESALITSKLSVSGRLAQQGKSIAWLDTRELAEKLLGYWMPQLKARWPSFDVQIFENIASKDQIRWMKKSSKDAKDILNNNDQCPVHVRKVRENNTPSLARYLITVILNNETYYYAGKVKGSIRFSPSKDSAKRYVTLSACERIMMTLPLSDQYKFNFLTLALDEALELNKSAENGKNMYWDCILGRH